MKQNQSQVLVTHKKYLEIGMKKEWMMKGFPKVWSRLKKFVKAEEWKIELIEKEDLNREKQDQKIVDYL